MKVAMRDLEIRGAGNILGTEQSGQVASIGFNLYCKLLKRTVLAMQGKIPTRNGNQNSRSSRRIDYPFNIVSLDASTSLMTAIKILSIPKSEFMNTPLDRIAGSQAQPLSFAVSSRRGRLFIFDDFLAPVTNDFLCGAFGAKIP